MVYACKKYALFCVIHPIVFLTTKNALNPSRFKAFFGTLISKSLERYYVDGYNKNKIIKSNRKIKTDLFVVVMQHLVGFPTILQNKPD